MQRSATISEFGVLSDYKYGDKNQLHLTLLKWYKNINTRSETKTRQKCQVTLCYVSMVPVTVSPVFSTLLCSDWQWRWSRADVCIEETHKKQSDRHFDTRYKICLTWSLSRRKLTVWARYRSSMSLDRWKVSRKKPSSWHTWNGFLHKNFLINIMVYII